ncbi:hypothetical protein FJT64_019066 [Amphibalanus amphitrite]|uniref:Uncharacterized protein n=1 Tax=Amphibalanus amphitrite TaxID=1232801 RepID=A0A6A4WR93_AMPAM|nr:hypothetical protein FJT64_019066 [Amphibalanus amphitrite]
MPLSQELCGEVNSAGEVAGREARAISHPGADGEADDASPVEQSARQRAKNESPPRNHARQRLSHQTPRNTSVLGKWGRALDSGGQNDRVVRRKRPTPPPRDPVQNKPATRPFERVAGNERDFRAAAGGQPKFGLRHKGPWGHGRREGRGATYRVRDGVGKTKMWHHDHLKAYDGQTCGLPREVAAAWFWRL